jgi:gliding motility-associated-like protein
MRTISFIAFLALFIIVSHDKATAQCSFTVSSYPYYESFESGNGGWNSAGVNDDWVMGSPSKPTISSAATGTNCWITGGLSSSFYNYGERSWLQSPCFDFSSLSHPVISFNIFWETEYKYDGANLQYSIDGGTTWINVGTSNEATDCYTQNWYNYSNIINLNSLASPSNGWCGTLQPTSGSCQGGYGSGGWVAARHCLSALAHQQQVIFRFMFGAGTTCNNYDGFAFDDVKIEDAMSPVAAFNWNCTSSSTIGFSSLSTNCADNLQWNFGDNTSGSGQNPSHTYNAGSYFVTLIAMNACSGNDTIQRNVTIINAGISSTPESCPGSNNGTALINPVFTGTYSYLWSTSPSQTTATASNLTAGMYSVTLTQTNSCPLTLTVQVLSGSSSVNAVMSSTETSCTGVNDGTGIISISDTGVFTYTWNTSPMQTTDTAFNLSPGVYTVTVNSASLCTPASFSVDVFQGNAGTPFISLGNDTIFCSGNPLILRAGNFDSYMWNDGTTLPELDVQKEGTYFLTVTNSRGCTASDTIVVEESCLDDIELPNSFTPNSDGRNDLYYAYGIHVKSFTLEIFNRWGEKIFETNDRHLGWSGKYKNTDAPEGIYTCLVKYSMNGKVEKIKTGMILLIR